MFRSSTSSSEQRRRWRRVAGVAVGLVLIAEMGLRIPAVEGVVGPPDLYYHPGVAERLETFAEFERSGLSVDVLFVGSSVVRTNVSPFVFDDALADLGLEVVSFNAGMSSLEPDPVRVYLDHVWLDRVRPRIVVQAVRYEDIANATPAADFEPFDGGRYEQLWLDDSPVADAQEVVLRSSRLVQYAGVLTAMLASPAALQAEGFEIDARGFNRTERVLSEVRRTFDLDAIPGGAAAASGYDVPIADETYDAGLEILLRTSQRVEASGGEYVLVNMPEHADKFLGQPRGEERYEHYVAALRRFAESEGIVFIDLVADGLGAFGDDTMFADFNHMTPVAAERLSRTLAAQIAGVDALVGALAGN